MIQAIRDFFWPEYCPCGEQKIGGKCPIGVELDDDGCAVGEPK